MSSTYSQYTFGDPEWDEINKFLLARGLPITEDGAVNVEGMRNEMGSVVTTIMKNSLQDPGKSFIYSRFGRTEDQSTLSRKKSQCARSSRCRRRRHNSDKIVHPRRFRSDRDLSIDGLVSRYPNSAFRYQPILTIHCSKSGGGFVAGELETDDADLKLLAASENISIVSVDYRLAPEHVFPVQINDSLAALKWVSISLVSYIMADQTA